MEKYKVRMTSNSNLQIKKEDLGKTLVYYSGGSGPSNSTVENNDMFLMNWLKEKGIEFSYVDHPLFKGEEAFKVVKVAGLLISYDRWGFCVDDEQLKYRPELIRCDQCLFQKVVELIELAEELTSINQL